MKDYYKNVRFVIDRYNQIANKIFTFTEETNEDDDEFLQNFCLHMAHALIKDFGYGQISRDELSRIANIINDVVI